MVRNTRREFLGDVGRGMLLAGLGSSLAFDLGLAPAWAAETESSLTFGQLEPLVGLMQDTAPDKLTGLLIDRLKSGEELKTLVAAGALANARTFGGEDYIGFHTFMALAPAYRMAQQLPSELRPLPVLKVLYRNTNRIQEFGGRKSEVLHPVEAQTIPDGVVAGEYLRATGTPMRPSAPLPRCARARSARRSTICSSKSKTKSTSIASSLPGARGIRSNWPVRTGRTACSVSRCGTVPCAKTR
jgi:hypothetical protein